MQDQPSPRHATPTDRPSNKTTARQRSEAAALRANLRKRKAQARERDRAPEPPKQK